MNLSPIGKACLIAREGRRLMTYADSVGVPTIGIGCTTINGKPVAFGMQITAAECDALFDATWPRYAAVAKVVGDAELPDHEADALISFCYNIGIAGFTGSTVAKLLKAGNFGAVPGAMMLWKIPAAIIARRQAEADQFGTPYTTALPRATSTAKPVAVPIVVTRPSAPAVAEPQHAAQTAPVLVPVILPPAHPWLDALGGWVDRVFGPAHPGHAEIDLAARG